MQATMPQLLAPPAMSPPQMHSVSSVAPPPTLPPVLQAGLAPFVGIDCSQHEDSDASTTDGCPEDCASSDDLACFLHNSSSDFEDSPFLRSGGFSDMLTHAADEGASACIDSFDENVTSKACDIIRNTFIHFAEPKLPQHGARHRARSLPKNIRIVAAATRSSSPCSTSRFSWADEDPYDCSLDMDSLW